LLARWDFRVPFWLVKVKAYVVVLWVMTLCSVVGTTIFKKHGTASFTVFKQYVPQKRRYHRTRLCGVITHKTRIWIFAVLKTSTFMLLW
jgi:hypothetical protein